MKVSTGYLVFYNAAQVAGWSVVLFLTGRHIISGGDYSTVYKVVTPWLHVFQTLAVLEVLHAAVGLVRSPVMTTVIQVTSRLMILWPVTYAVTDSQQSVGVLIYVLAWSITEVIRYSYYAAALFNNIPSSLQWARYTFFIGLYPLGVAGELTTLYASLGQIKRQSILSVALPNVVNMSFHFNYALIAFALLYAPLFPKMYFYMFAQRRKIIGGKSIDSKKKAA